MLSKKGKKPLEEVNGHFSFSPSSEEYFPFPEEKREAEFGALSRATRLASKHSGSAFHGAVVGEPLF